jgi:hypothetical protein
MDEPFDPYRKWLGIPLKDQPPHHYRLLGIELFESDPDVIDHAADRQMAHVRAFQSGQHAAASQKLLTELSAARLCLLTPATKATYDAQLRARFTSGQYPSGANIPYPSDPPAPAIFSVTAATQPLAKENTLRFQPVARRSRRSATLVPLGIVAMVGAAILLIAGLICRNLPPASSAAAVRTNAGRLAGAQGKEAFPTRKKPDSEIDRTQPSERPEPSKRTTPMQLSESWISRDATYAVSSTGEGVLALSSLLTEDDPEREYAVHSQGGEAGAHIVIDLGSVKQITRLEIVNRRDPALYARAQGMQLWLASGRSGADDSRFPLPPYFDRAIWTAEQGLALYQVKLKQPAHARFIKLGFPPERTEFLHLAKVRVYGYE